MKANKKWKALLEKLPTTPKFTMETMYALMQYAEAQEPGERERFIAMDCHTAILDFAKEGGRQCEDVLGALGMAERITLNQERLGIV